MTKLKKGLLTTLGIIVLLALAGGIWFKFKNEFTMLEALKWRNRLR